MLERPAISPRAHDYLATLTRLPAPRDRERIEAAFHAASVPVLEPIVVFQMAFGGYVEWYGRNRFEWGILFDQPDPDSFFEPNRLDIDVVDGEYWVTCANCHGSDHWSLDGRGRLYWCGFPKAASFAVKVERDALDWELAKTGGGRKVVTTADRSDLLAALIPRIAEGQIVEACDEHEAVYLHHGLLVIVTDDRIQLYLLDDSGNDVLAGIPL